MVETNHGPYDGLFCYGSDSLNLLPAAKPVKAERCPSLKYGGEPLTPPSPSPDWVLEPVSRSHIRFEPWQGFSILISGFNYNWFQVVERVGDEVRYRQVVVGLHPPSSIRRAVKFLGRVGNATPSLTDTVDGITVAWLTGRVAKLERVGRVILLATGTLHILNEGVPGEAGEDLYVTLSTRVKDVACSRDKLVFIDEGGQLNKLGLDAKPGAEGLEVEGFAEGGETGSLPRRVKFVQVASGLNHFLALTSRGELYAWGGSRFGETGHGDLCEYARPKRNLALAGIPISAIACGSFHSAVLSESGDVYTFGLNRDGQLGRTGEGGAEAGSFGVPGLVRFLGLEEGPDIASVRCGPNHTLILDEARGQYLVAGGTPKHPKLLGSSMADGRVWGAVLTLGFLGGSPHASGQIQADPDAYDPNQPLYEAEFNRGRRITHFVLMMEHEGLLEGYRAVDIGAGGRNVAISFHPSHPGL
ncbi:hypothetical protein L0F63_003305 [Massospora cicadina]|nr:hypothetical protein L0F63_003305 [Massospora cicadina]